MKTMYHTTKEESTTDEAHQINTTMTGGGRTVLIRGQMCRALLGDKGKTLSHRG